MSQVWSRYDRVLTATRLSHTTVSSMNNYIYSKIERTTEVRMESSSGQIHDDVLTVAAQPGDVILRVYFGRKGFLIYEANESGGSRYEKKNLFHLTTLAIVLLVLGFFTIWLMGVGLLLMIGGVVVANQAGNKVKAERDAELDRVRRSAAFQTFRTATASE